MNPPITDAAEESGEYGTTGAAGIVSANLQGQTDADDPLVKVWADRIKAAHRLVHKYDLRIIYQRLGETDPLQHPF